MTVATRPSEEAPTLGRHPLGLYVLALTGMWEAFALFGTRTVLVYYLVKQLGFAGAAAIQVYAYSVGAAMLLSLAGGYVADRMLGARRAILFGALLMAAASFALTAPALLYPALAASAVGYGLFRPTLSMSVGQLYGHDDPRLDRGYAVFTAICNLGGALAPFVCGAIGETWGWSYAFAASGAGMLVAAAVFALGHRHTGAMDFPRPAAAIAEPASSSGATALVLTAVWLGAVLVWTAYNQIGGAVALWADSSLERVLSVGAWRFEVPAAWFQSVNPVVVIALTPVVTWIWSRERRPAGAGRDFTKMIVGAALVGLSYFAIAAAAAGAERASGLWLLLAIIPFSIGELFFSPIGQAAFSRLAPARLPSLFMSLWFLTMAFGFWASGWYGALWGRLPAPVFFAGAALVAVGGCLVIAAAAIAHARRAA